MKNYSNQAKLSPVHFRPTIQQQLYESAPFFSPTHKHPLPSVMVKSHHHNGKHLVVVSVEQDGELFIGALLRFLRANCHLNSEATQESCPQSAQFLKDTPAEGFLQKVDFILHENLDVEHFGGSDIAKQLCCCEMQLYRKLKKLTNLSPANYIRRFRLQRSMQLLQQTAHSISEICYLVGFSSLEYFSRSFKKEYGVCPSSVRDAKMLK